MAAILINPGVVVFKDPINRGSHRHKWWAEGGLVNWHDLDAGPADKQYGTQTVIDTLHRLRGINDMIGNSRTGKGWNRPDEMQAYGRFIDAMVELCKTAREQGMPDDRAHSRQLVQAVKDKRRSRITVPGLAAAQW